jgi:hypothetical protein
LSWPRPRRRDDRGPRPSDELSPCRFEKRRRRARGNFLWSFACTSRNTSSAASNESPDCQERNTSAPSKTGTMRCTSDSDRRSRPDCRRASHDDLIGFGHQGFQAFPAKRILHCRSLIRSGILGDQHGFGHADQRSDRRIERLRSIEDVLLPLPIGATNTPPSILSNITRAASVRPASIALAKTTRVANLPAFPRMPPPMPSQ